MIRDPSDGTVREHHPKPLKPKAKLPEGDSFGTGLRQPTRTDAQVRLEESRTWLKDYYHAKKEREHAQRGSDEQSTGDVRDRAGG